MRSGTLMIGIAGGTGSGKTTLVRKLGERFGSSVSVVCHDWYYRAQNGLSLEERARQNYDRPEAFEKQTCSCATFCACATVMRSTVRSMTTPCTTARRRR